MRPFKQSAKLPISGMGRGGRFTFQLLMLSLNLLKSQIPCVRSFAGNFLSFCHKIVTSWSVHFDYGRRARSVRGTIINDSGYIFIYLPKLTCLCKFKTCKLSCNREFSKVTYLFLFSADELKL